MYRPVFLLGLMRSGTTYLRSVIASSPSVYSLGPEQNRFWTEIGQAPSGLVPRCVARRREDATDAIAASVRAAFERRYRRRNSVSEIAYRIYRKAWYGNETILKRGEPVLLLDKTTHLCNKIDYLDGIFSDSLFVFLIRDIHSHANSMQLHLGRLLARGGWRASYPKSAGQCWSFTRDSASGSHCFADIPRYWMEQNAFALSFLDGLPTHRKLIITHRDVTKNLESVLDRVGEFLSISLVRGSVRTQLVNNQTQDPLEEWRRVLTAEQRATIDRIIGESRDTYDFVLSHIED